MQKKIVINSKEISLLKPLTTADYESKTILTDSSWEYVELWLMRQKDTKSQEALFFWQQAKHFFEASESLPLNSKPLTSYYCCLNATKALLCINGVNVTNISHGISRRSHSGTSNNSLEKANVNFNGSGVLWELSRHLGESINKETYSIKDLMYNIPCIHRTFAVTYPGFSELFIPIKNLHFVREETTSQAWIQFSVDSRYANGNALRSIPSGYKKTIVTDDSQYYIRKESNRFKWSIHSGKKERFNSLRNYHKKVRKDIYYIYGQTKLWYLKKDIKNNTHIIPRSSLTLIFAVMHWLSELVRYNPEKFTKYMDTKQNWLLHEFIERALFHFIDEISCEITHQEIMCTGYKK